MVCLLNYHSCQIYQVLHFDSENFNQKTTLCINLKHFILVLPKESFRLSQKYVKYDKLLITLSLILWFESDQDGEKLTYWNFFNVLERSGIKEKKSLSLSMNGISALLIYLLMYLPPFLSQTIEPFLNPDN